MADRLDLMVRVKQMLSVLIILFIPLGLFFAWDRMNNEISYKYEVLLPEDFLLKHMVVRR
ncbi:MAG: hypothetical protein IPM49_03435 [Flavobacteriales bacterium]|nr:hypothetical protein [Flavobacteriales bacterium]